MPPWASKSARKPRFNPQRVILRARTLLPITRPPIENGAVVVEGGRIVQFGPWRTVASTLRAGKVLRPADPLWKQDQNQPPRAGSSAIGTSPWIQEDPSAPDHQIIDLGDRVLLPGLVNAHCHLDYTDMAGQIPPTRTFTDWIRSINALKNVRGEQEYTQSWLQGANMLLQYGTTAIANVEAVPSILPEVIRQTPLRVFTYLELIGIKREFPPAEVLEKALASLKTAGSSVRLHGLSPHAPYSTTQALVQHAVRIARQNQWRLTTHLAESREECEMFLHRRGPLYEWLRNQRDMSDCGHHSPVQHLAALGALTEEMLAVHVNYLQPGDADILGGQKTSVVHCPRSHQYFQHLPFPEAALSAAGVNVSLGTDSLATVLTKRGQSLELNLFAEMQALARSQPQLAAESILRMATVNGARALGQNGQIGQICPGAWADFIAVPCPASCADYYAAVVHYAEPVDIVMIGGRFIRPHVAKAACFP